MKIGPKEAELRRMREAQAETVRLPHEKQRPDLDAIRKQVEAIKPKPPKAKKAKA